MSIDEEADGKGKKKEKEILVVQDTSFFKHSTGDTYEGYFEAKKKDMSVKMHGTGTYTTNEGDAYTGVWEYDKFGYGGEEASITYHSGAKYEGFIKDFSYNGRGKYTYPDGSYIEAEFSDNCPVGNMKFTDPNGHLWFGKADTGFGWCDPVNHYYDVLDSNLDRSEIRRRRRELKPGEQPMVKIEPIKKAKSKVLGGKVGMSDSSLADTKRKVKIHV